MLYICNIKTKQLNKMRRFKGLNINIKCTDKENKIGTFLTNDKGEQVTKTYKNADALFKSIEYSNIKY